MKEIFAKNLRRAREADGLTREKIAESIDVKPKTYAAWEEERGFPSEKDLISLALVLRITDLIGFISNPAFDIAQQLQKAQKPDSRLTNVQKAYEMAGVRDKLAVNILLGLVDLS